MTTIIQHTSNQSTTIDLFGTPIAGDVLVAIGIGISSENTAGITASGCGATWVRAYLGSRSSVWVGTGATSSGIVAMGTSSSTALWHLRDVEATATAWEYFGASGSPLLSPVAAPAVEVGPTQVVMALARRAATQGATGTLPSPGAWTAVASGALTLCADAAPAATDQYAQSMTFTTSTGNERVFVQVVIGSPPAPEPIITDDRYWTNRLAASLGLDPAVVQPVVEVRTWDKVAGAWSLDPDLSHALAGYTVSYGRSGATGTADPITATLSLVTRLAAATPEAATRLQVALCEPVATALGLTPAEAVRFTGEVTDPAVNHATRLTSLVCVGRLGRGNRTPVDGTAWPVEDDGDRVARILTGTGLGLSVGTIDAGTANLATPARSEAAAKLLDLAVNSTGGQVVEQPEGVVDWHDANHRRGVNPALTLSASEVFRSITWAQRVGEVVNAATVKYAGGDIEVTDSYSADPVSGYGPYPASIDTALVDEEDAYALGSLLVGRRARPAWTLPDVLVDLIRTVPLADLTQLLALRHGDRLLIEGLPEGCPVPPKVFVEGWTQTATATQWRQTVAVSDPMLSGISPRYMDVPLTDSYQYADVDPALTYLGVMRTEDPAELL